MIFLCLLRIAPAVALTPRRLRMRMIILPRPGKTNKQTTYKKRTTFSFKTSAIDPNRLNHLFIPELLKLALIAIY